jgi:hypothetical protein
MHKAKSINKGVETNGIVIYSSRCYLSQTRYNNYNMRKSLTLSITLLCLLFSMVTKAQVASDTLEKKIHFYSSLGLGMIDKSFQPAARSSIQTSTGVEYRLDIKKLQRLITLMVHLSQQHSLYSIDIGLVQIRCDHI